MRVKNKITALVFMLAISVVFLSNVASAQKKDTVTIRDTIYIEKEKKTATDERFEKSLSIVEHES